MKHRLQEAFDKIHAEQEIQSRTIEFLENHLNKGGKKRSVSVKWIAAVACFALLLPVGMGFSTYLTPAFAISIDINPSIELGVNHFNRVVSVDTYNEDGYAVMSAVDVYHLNYKEALEQILTDEGMKEYIVQDQPIAVTVFGKDEKKSSELLDTVAACTSSYANVHCASGNSREVAEAHGVGLSFGKYKAFLELKALDPDLTVEEIRGLTMCQIWDRIDELSGNDSTNRNSVTDGCGWGRHNGWGQGRGNGLCRQGRGRN